MSVRTDLAIEEKIAENGINISKENIGEVEFCTVEIFDEEKAQKIGKRKGKYITLEFPSTEKINGYDDIKKGIKKALKMLLPEGYKNILVVGLGNTEITADSIGPKTAVRLLATRHIAGEFAENIGLKGLRSVAVITPNVLGKTGIEVTELISGLVQKIKPDAVIAIDALASRSIDRLFRTVQLSDSGISPGSGVKNARKELSFQTLGVPVIALGVPTVVDALTLAFELTGKESQTDTDLVVTPKDSDLLSHRISEILAEALNVFLQPEIDEEIILSLV
ncbi:MAG: GPR endopeptidase [Acutalibacteraceae bacterium]|nr:GPR endopeptidase [Acutalibacteraceae bacterium]